MGSIELSILSGECFVLCSGADPGFRGKKGTVTSMGRTGHAYPQQRGMWERGELPHRGLQLSHFTSHRT